MRTAILLVLILLVKLPALSQVGAYLYYDNYWKLTTRDDAIYFRTTVLDTVNLLFAGSVKDYFREGQPQMVGAYQSGLRHGNFIFYYKSGQTKIKGAYDQGRRVGEWQYFYPDGSLQQRVEFSEGDFHVWEYYDSLGQALVEEGSGPWKNRYYEPGNPEQIVVEGEFLNGKKHGKWECRTASGRIYYRETFDKGQFIKGKAINQLGQRAPKYDTEVNNKLIAPYKLAITEQFIFSNEEAKELYPYLAKVEIPEEVRFANIDVQPVYPGGMHQVYRHIAKHLTYPEQARRNGVQGKVFVQFVVEKDGSVSGVETIEGIGGGCDKEAERVVGLMDKWEPGYLDGEPVRVRMVLPIAFQFQ